MWILNQSSTVTYDRNYIVHFAILYEQFQNVNFLSVSNVFQLNIFSWQHSSKIETSPVKNRFFPSVSPSVRHLSVSTLSLPYFPLNIKSIKILSCRRGRVVSASARRPGGLRFESHTRQQKMYFSALISWKVCYASGPRRGRSNQHMKIANITGAYAII